jgi:hypothetical protein
MQQMLLTLALICTAGISYAQTSSSGSQNSPEGQPIGRNDWVRQPGDQPGPRSGMAMPATQPMGTGQSMPGQSMRGGHMGGGTAPGPGTHGHSSSPKQGETKAIQDMQHNMPATPSHSPAPR